MKYVAVYNHILINTNKCDPEWVLTLIYGTREGHRYIIATGKFIPYSAFDKPTIVEQDPVWDEWETEVVPFNTLEETFEDIRKKEAWYDLQDIERMYSSEYFGLTDAEQRRIMDFLCADYNICSTIESGSEEIKLQSSDTELPF